MQVTSKSFDSPGNPVAKIIAVFLGIVSIGGLIQTFTVEGKYSGSAVIVFSIIFLISLFIFGLKFYMEISNSIEKKIELYGKIVRVKTVDLKPYSFIQIFGSETFTPGSKSKSLYFCDLFNSYSAKQGMLRKPILQAHVVFDSLFENRKNGGCVEFANFLSDAINLPVKLDKKTILQQGSESDYELARELLGNRYEK